MKKLLSVFVAVAMVMGFSMTASAADSVDVTLTSPTITKAEGACEKVGAVTFEFSSGAVLEKGDWWYMDLPEGAELCKGIDYLIVGDAAGGPASNNTWVSVDSLDPTLVLFGGGTGYAIGGGTGTTLTAAGITGNPPITVQDLSGASGVVNVTGNVALRVVGKSGSRRVTLYVASDAVGTGSLTVTPDTTMKIKVFDGAHHEGGTANAENSRIILDVDMQRFTTLGGTTTSDTGRYQIFGQMDGDAGYDPELDEIIDSSAQVPHIENTLCVNAEEADGNLFVSFASKNDFLTFTGDSQIAHTGGGVSFSLEACAGKLASLDEILLANQDACVFDYENTNGYCDTHVAGYIYMQAADTFGEIDERFDLSVDILTDGVYFGGAPALMGFLSSQDACEDMGAAVTTGTIYYCVGNDCSDQAGSDAEWPADDSCTVDDDEMVDRIFTKGGSVTGINNFAQMSFNFQEFHYDTSIVAAGDEVELEVTMDKYPCGTIGTDTIIIGTFVTECTTTATGTSSLFFPFLPGSQFVGWWGGYVVANGSTDAGTAVLMATDVDGNSASYETPEIAAYGQFNASFLEVADWTQSASNAANFDGSANYTVFVTCNFNRGSGMAMLGNSTEGVGYTADTTGW